MAPKRGRSAREKRSVAVIPVSPQSRRLPEVWVVWLLFGLATVAVFETYWRLPPAELWKVTNSGFVGGVGRAFVFVSFSAAGSGLGVLPLLPRRPGQPRAPAR